MEERINILIGSDINYAPYYGVMLTSLFINNRESHFDVYLLTDETWSNAETERFSKLCDRYESNFHVYVVNVDILKKFPKSGHITLPTYYRLQACNILPDSIHKILYLDGDMIVLGDIRPLWNINLEGYAFAGAEDCDSLSNECYLRLGYERKYGYYNAGVSLYNFDYWRQNHISEKLIELINTKPEIMKWMDQDAVNCLLHKKRMVIPRRWDFEVYYMFHQWWDKYDDNLRREIVEEGQNAVIVHYNGTIKPWSFKYLGYPFSQSWRYYNELSLWKIDINKPRGKYIKHLIKHMFPSSIAFNSRNKSVVKDFWNYETACHSLK